MSHVKGFQIMAQSQVNATGRNKTPPSRQSAPKGKPEVAAEKAGQTAIIQLKKAALSVDVGPMVIASLDAVNKQEAAANQALEEVKGKRYDLLAKTTQAIVKAAKGDSSIDLGAVFSGDPKQMGALNDKLGLALGFREIITTEKDKNGVAWQKVVTAKAVSKYFPIAGEDKNTPEYKRKDTLRGNFLHMLKKCAQGAAAIIEKGINTKYDPKQATLVISGPAVVKQFGQDNIALDEKKTRGEGDGKVELNEKPSFTALAAMGAEGYGAEVTRGNTSRSAKIGTTGGAAVAGATPRGVNLTMGQAIVQIAKSLVGAVEKYTEKMTPEVKTALQSAQSAIEVKLSNA